MKDLQELVKAFDYSNKLGLKTALATVVHVIGSAYRHEGGRMLINENGDFTGAISGGCLEGDALRKARMAMRENRNILVTYDTTDDDDATLGVGLGCNGVIQVLLEPINIEDPLNPINLFKSFLKKRQQAALGTFFNLENRLALQPGTCLLLTDNQLQGEIEATIVKASFIPDANNVLEKGHSIVKNYEETNLTCFIEYLPPPVHLLVFGAGNDAIPLVQFGSILGWEISVIDGRPNYATALRFPSAKQILVTKPDNVFSQLVVDNWTVAVLMTHNYSYDITILKHLLNFNVKYIGALGPKKKLERMIKELTDSANIIQDEKLNTIFGPTGLDIGSDTPEEIALSIVAEIKAVLSNRNGGSLKFRAANKDLSTISLEKHPLDKFTSCDIKA